MPGRSFNGPLPEISPEEQRIARSLESDVRFLSVGIGERNTAKAVALSTAASWIDERLREIPVKSLRKPYTVRGHNVYNIEAIIPGSSINTEVVVVGAHYDSALGTPGANDNATGVACLLELARRLGSNRATRELRLVWFTNEEPPYFHTKNMGSYNYAQALVSERRNIVAMLSLETLGYYSNVSGSQQYPGAVSPFFHNIGNFLAFVGNDNSADLVRQSIGIFRRTTSFPSEGLSLSSDVQGIGWSDHWSFWQVGVQAIMITDTAPFRYQHYHRASDTPEQIDYARLARVTVGLEKVIRSLLGSDN
jgi:Zn-dependent M28 family amino/carboxypeptidase